MLTSAINNNNEIFLPNKLIATIIQMIFFLIICFKKHLRRRILSMSDLVRGQAMIVNINYSYDWLLK